MKRIMLTLLSLLCLMSVASCGDGKSSSDKKEAAEGVSASSLVVVYDGVAYGVNQKVDAIRKALGEPSGVIATQSCHYGDNGDEYWFYYYYGEGSFDTSGEDMTDVLSVHTVPLKAGVDTICDIECHTARATTDKGITVGSSAEEVFSAYGDGYVDEGDGFFTYYDGEALPTTPRLMFHIVDDSVEYFAVSAANNI